MPVPFQYRWYVYLYFPQFLSQRSDSTLKNRLWRGLTRPCLSSLSPGRQWLWHKPQDTASLVQARGHGGTSPISTSGDHWQARSKSRVTPKLALRKPANFITWTMFRTFRSRWGPRHIMRYLERRVGATIDMCQQNLVAQAYSPRRLPPARRGPAQARRGPVWTWIIVPQSSWPSRCAYSDCKRVLQASWERRYKTT